MASFLPLFRSGEEARPGPGRSTSERRSKCPFSIGPPGPMERGTDGNDKKISRGEWWFRGACPLRLREIRMSRFLTLAFSRDRRSQLANAYPRWPLLRADHASAQVFFWNNKP